MKPWLPGKSQLIIVFGSLVTTKAPGRAPHRPRSGAMHLPPDFSLWVPLAACSVDAGLMAVGWKGNGIMHT